MAEISVLYFSPKTRRNPLESRFRQTGGAYSTGFRPSVKPRTDSRDPAHIGISGANLRSIVNRLRQPPSVFGNIPFRDSACTIRTTWHERFYVLIARNRGRLSYLGRCQLLRHKMAIGRPPPSQIS